MSTQIVRPETASHWYKVDENNNIKAFHNVPYAGKRGENGETRSTTLRDARKEGAFPSVTNILGMLHKEFLTAYRINQAILASLTLPREEDEGGDAFARRVLIDSKERASSAARLGERLHELGAIWLQDPSANPNIEGERTEGRILAEIAHPLRDLLRKVIPDEKATKKEFLVAHPLGFAGCCDGLMFLDPKDDEIASKLREAGFGVLVEAGDPVIAVADIKSRGADQKSPPIYETDILQLSAYLHAIPNSQEAMRGMTATNTPAINVLVNTHEKAGQDGRWVADIHVHKVGDIRDAFAAFMSLHRVWCWAKNYYPSPTRGHLLSPKGQTLKSLKEITNTHP